MATVPDVIMCLGPRTTLRPRVQAALDFGMYDVKAAEPGYLLTLSLPGEDEDTCFYDKLDIVEEQGMAASQPFTLKPREAPPPELLAFLRLMNIAGLPLLPSAMRGSSRSTCCLRCRLMSAAYDTRWTHSAHHSP